jgi:HK97 family phage prohead protease
METKMLLQFSSDITCNAEERTITGKIVPFGDSEVGHTNVGKVVFEAGSIEIPTNPKPKLLLEHDPKKPIGRLISFTENESGIYATFKVSATTRGNDALIEASEQLRSGLSVGVEVIAGKQDKDRYRVKSSLLKEVSLVQAAAFKSAEVLSVAASEETPEADEQPTTNESEAVVENTPDTATVEPKAETPAVEAARPTVAAPMYAKPRINVTPAAYVENTIRAALGDDDARVWIKAASDTDTTNDVPGLVPTRQLTELINPKSTGVRPSIDAISSGVLPDAGMKFQIPRVKTVPTVGVVSEGGAFDDTQVEIEYLDVDVKKFAGMQKFSVEVLDRTSPQFFAELTALMSDAYAKQTNKYAKEAIMSVATVDATTVTLPWDGEELSAFVARGAASIYSNTFSFATGAICSPEQWANLIGLTDSNKRPILTAIQPQNAAGSVGVDSIRGNLLGLDLYVDYTEVGEGDATIMIVNRDSFTWYESPRLQLRAETVGSGKIEIGLYGYGALATKKPKGAFRFNKA